VSPATVTRGTPDELGATDIPTMPRESPDVRTAMGGGYSNGATTSHHHGETAGREAVDLVMQLAPDVVVMDLSMPVLDGRAATMEIVATHIHTRARLGKQRIQEKMSFSHRSHYVQFAMRLGLLGPA
jgi:hypothetical protein